MSPTGRHGAMDCARRVVLIAPKRCLPSPALQEAPTWPTEPRIKALEVEQPNWRPGDKERWARAFRDGVLASLAAPMSQVKLEAVLDAARDDIFPSSSGPRRRSTCRWRFRMGHRRHSGVAAFDADARATLVAQIQELGEELRKQLAYPLPTALAEAFDIDDARLRTDVQMSADGVGQEVRGRRSPTVGRPVQQTSQAPGCRDEELVAVRSWLDLFDDFECELGGDGEADAVRVAGTAENAGVDADQVAVRIDQGAAGISRVDRCVCLHEIVVGLR